MDTETEPIQVINDAPESASSVESNEDPSSNNFLFDKLAIEKEEINRVEQQNSEYREKLIKVIRERDLNEQLLRESHEQNEKEKKDVQRKLRDLESQLKAVNDRASAQESHYNVTIREMSLKYNDSVFKITKKADMSEREKQEAVIKYATKEAELMRMKAELIKKDSELSDVKKKLAEMIKSQLNEHVEALEKKIQSLTVTLESSKHENFDLENRLKIAEKRVETTQTALNDAKGQFEVLRKQQIQSKDEKFQSQKIEQKFTEEMEKRKKIETELNLKLQEAEKMVQKLKSSQMDMAEKLEAQTRENSQLLEKLEVAGEKLLLEEERRKLCEEQVSRLSKFENDVLTSSENAYQCKEEAENARLEKENAIEEAQTCRVQAEKMLSMTQKLTEQNVLLSTNLTVAEREKQKLLEQLREKAEQLEKLNMKTHELNEEVEKLKEQREEREENESKTLTDDTIELNQLQSELESSRNELRVYKKKVHATIKELRTELASVRKTNPTTEYELAPPAAADCIPSMSSRSRASSLTSLDRVTNGSREEEAQNNEKSEQQKVQSAMIEKIVVLQRKLARRGEKIEFLDEHVKQCLEELQKKTKIIQHYALREEASLLLPEDDSLDKVPILRASSAYALMGAMFTGSDKKAAQISCEVNSRLQAVLEDCIHKNIMLKSSLDVLKNENNKLSRENRLLTLSQARLSEETAEEH